MPLTDQEMESVVAGQAPSQTPSAEEAAPVQAPTRGVLGRAADTASDLLTSAAHGISSGTGFISRATKNALIRPEELAELEGEYQKAQTRSPITSTVGNFAGEGTTPESMLVGQAAGTALGMVAKPLASAASRGLGNLANKYAASTLKGTAGEYKALGADQIQALGKWLLDRGAVTPLATRSAVAGRVGPLKDAAGTAYEEALSALDATGKAGLDKSQLADAFMKAAQEAEQHGPAAKPIVDKFLQAAADAEQSAASQGAKGSFSQGEAWKQGYQKIAYPKGKPPIDPSALQLADQEIAGIAKRQVEEAAERAAQGSGQYEQFLQAKKNYGAAKTADRLLGGAEARAEARNIASPSDKAALLGTLLASHNVPLALAAGAGNRLVRDRAAPFLASSLRGVSDLLQAPGPLASSVGNAAARGVPSLVHGALTAAGESAMPMAAQNDSQVPPSVVNFTSLIQHSPALQQAQQQGGKQGLYAAHYIESQRNPQYREIQRALSGEDKP